MDTRVHTTSGKAVWSLVFGVLNWVLVPFVGAVVAVVFGHLARADILRSQGQLGGDGFAVTGLLLGWIAIAVSLLVLVLVIGLLGVALVQVWVA